MVHGLIILLFAIIMAPLLSVCIIMAAFNVNLASYNRVYNYNTSIIIVDNTIYSASTVDKAMLDCLMLF